ncbi:flagellar basal body rod protein FlgC [Anaeropeptidivorans aminofermentans]|jgi:flagellar basal-body rod protein FlgC|uniref:flagellar basal body rod protein FlgC n=1 Tax=Anaeropeptidivorans aminofermentans TaxID=2934315 RepID=UPI00202457EC|nr:flagellar basal body rod protein FlgC [Anaeropeptidivorans aminofermentans]MBE6011958.1 flagellar basal body rod protein FlgC [Lachnospiraceae bacterium]
MSDFFGTMDTSVTGLSAQRLRMDIISQNIANASTTKTADGTPYKRKSVLFQELKPVDFSGYFVDAVNKYNKSTGKGVKVSKIITDDTPGAKEYNPTHPDADADGYVEHSNVNIVSEMVNMISAQRSYEANVTAFNTTKAMINKTMEINK